MISALRVDRIALQQQQPVSFASRCKGEASLLVLRQPPTSSSVSCCATPRLRDSSSQRSAHSLSNPFKAATRRCPAPPLSAAGPARPVRVDPWTTIVEAEKSGANLEVVIKAVNKGGLVAAYGELKGFIPYNQLASRSQTADLSYLVGQTLKARVMSVDTVAGRKEFILSERKAQQSEAMRYVKVGSTVKAVVSSVEDYGAFVELVDVPGVTGLVHKSELSWDSIMSVDSVVQKGQVLKVKVIDLDTVKCRLGLSLKQTQPDPIKVTLDTVNWGPTKSMPAEIQQLMMRLKEQPEVEEVSIGRQATESKIASQELGVYLTKEASDTGFDVVARLGNVIQELRVVAKISRDEARALITRIAQGI